MSMLSKTLNYIFIILVCVSISAISLYADRNLGLLIEESDGSPSGYAYKLKFPNGSYSLSGGVGTFSIPAGGGDVSKVGTPAQYEWGEWTGDGTLKGTAVTGSKVVCTDANGSPTACTNLTDLAFSSYATIESINTPAELETVSNSGAYASDILAATDEANFKSIVNLEANTDFYAPGGTDVADADVANNLTLDGSIVTFDNHLIFGDSAIYIFSDDDGYLDFVADTGIRSSAPNFHHSGNFYATTYGSDGSVSDAELKYLANVTSDIQGQLDNITPGTGTDEHIVRWGAGNTLQDSTTAAIDDSDNLTGLASITMNQVATPTVAGYATADSGAITFSLSATSDGTDASFNQKVRLNGSLTNVFNIYYESGEARMDMFVELTTYGMIPETDSTFDIGATDNRYANIWGDAINGADYTYLNGWRSLESEKYEGYPKGIAFGNTCFEDGKVLDKMPDGCKPVFVVTEDFIEYQGIRATKDELKILIEMARGMKDATPISNDGYLLPTVGK